MKIGILGGGQLARMLALAAAPLGVQCRVFDPSSAATAAGFSEHVCAEYSDSHALKAFAEGLDCVSYEFENVPASVFASLPDSLPVYPDPAALKASQDRLHEKELFASLGIETAPYRSVSSVEEVEEAANELGYPCILKSRRFGYDGKGQAILRKKEDIASAVTSIGRKELILEGYVAFDRELSCLAVRSRQGVVRSYPLVENIHHEGILKQTIAPAAQVSEQQRAYAQTAVEKLLNELGYVGVVCIEFFALDDSLIANEFAPRVHNSGHWSIEGAYCSQFENHVRAVCGLPLGSTEIVEPCTMLNIISRFPDTQSLLRIDKLHLHSYEKQERSGRKLGHITLQGTHSEETIRSIEALLRS